MPTIWKDYWAWRWFMKWFAPLPVLLWYSRRNFGRNHVWWQGKDCQLELRPRFPDDGADVLHSQRSDGEV